MERKRKKKNHISTGGNFNNDAMNSYWKKSEEHAPAAARKNKSFPRRPRLNHVTGGERQETRSRDGWRAARDTLQIKESLFGSLSSSRVVFIIQSPPPAKCERYTCKKKKTLINRK